MPADPLDAIGLEVFKHLFASVAEEMGAVLRKASFSPNIKERRDFSCAIFDNTGRMIAQAAHIPVHLGSMPLSVLAAIEAFQSPASDPPGHSRLEPGDVIMLNDPYRGGTHLPDITLVSPVFISGDGPDKIQLFGYVASRAHHSDVGGMSPGSMPVAREIYQEGLILPPVRLVQAGALNQDILNILLANVRTPQERAGDILAQISANQRGILRMQELAANYGAEKIGQAMQSLLAYTERMTRALLRTIPDGRYEFQDTMDDDGIRNTPALIRVSVEIRGDEAIVDFSGSAPQQEGSINAVFAITLSAVYYVIRCLIGLDVPNNSGCLAPIQVIAPAGSIVNANPPAPVAGGNVETSQRIVDVLLGAVAAAVPAKVPAASQGTMNNLTLGGWDPFRQRQFAYYETIAGGSGASPTQPGASAVQTHMTNTLNTPVEALEFHYPIRVRRYEIRAGSGGEGAFKGGDGIVRELEILATMQATLLSDRRKTAPYGLSGGQAGEKGQNMLIQDGQQQLLPGKGSVELHSGDLLSIRTPGGGGFGKMPDKPTLRAPIKRSF